MWVLSYNLWTDSFVLNEKFSYPYMPAAGVLEGITSVWSREKQLSFALNKGKQESLPVVQKLSLFDLVLLNLLRKAGLKHQTVALGGACVIFEMNFLVWFCYRKCSFIFKRKLAVWRGSSYSGAVLCIYNVADMAKCPLVELFFEIFEWLNIVSYLRKKQFNRQFNALFYKCYCEHFLPEHSPSRLTCCLASLQRRQDGFSYFKLCG